MSISPSTPTPTPLSEKSLPPMSELQREMIEALKEANAKWAKWREERKAQALSKAKPETASR